MLRLAAVWPTITVPRDGKPDEVCPDETPTDKMLRWLWSRIEPDPIPGWIERTGLPDAPHTRRACQVLIDNAMALPDGTLAESVDTFIAAHAAAKMGMLMPRQRDDGA